MYKETKLRSVVKTISWRFWATITTVALIFIFIGEIEVALSIGFFEVILKMMIYFVHERVWDKVKFGRHEIQPAVIWLTGLVRAGKSEIAEKVVEKLKQRGMKAEHLDGHTIRHLIKETGFAPQEVNSHIKEIGYLASKLESHGIFVVASFLSPYRESRDFVKGLCKNFIEVHISTPANICEKRDTTGIYARAKCGEVSNFPGVNIPYEQPLDGALEINTEEVSIDEASEMVFERIEKYL